MRGAVALATVFCAAFGIVDAVNLRGSAISCSAPPGIYQGSVSYSGLKPGSTASYTCMKGCVITNSSPLRCTGHGMWSGTVPECRVQFLKKNDNSFKNGDKGYKLYSG